MSYRGTANAIDVIVNGAGKMALSGKASLGNLIVNGSGAIDAANLDCSSCQTVSGGTTGAPVVQQGDSF